MTDLRDRMRIYDQAPAPDYWSEVELRAAAASAGAAQPDRSARPILLLVAALLTILAISAAVAIGSGVVDLPAILPGPLPAPSVEASAAPLPSLEPEPQLGVVAYTESGRIWVVNADGTDARELIRFEPSPDVPDWQNSPDFQYPIGWSPDGSGLYYRYERYEFAGPEDGLGTPRSGLAMTDAAGSDPEELFDFTGSTSGGAWCPTPSEADNCQANVDGAAISPDGTGLAYSIHEGRNLEFSTIVILDISSGQVSRVESTRTQNPFCGEGDPLCEDPCGSDAGQGYNEWPSWSPDGTRLVFARHSFGPRVNGFCQSTIFTVNVDGSDLRRLVAPDVPALYPRWSPDGSTILFHTAPPDAISDIYTVRSDGTGLRPLIGGGDSVLPHWTGDGRIVFIRGLTPDGRGELWIMDSDGGNPMPLEPTIPALTAVGCLVCPYPNEQGQYWAEGRVNHGFWQPMPASQP